MVVNEHADEFDLADLRLRQDIEEAIEITADDFHDATLWWSSVVEGAGVPRPIDMLISRLVSAAKDYKNTIDNIR